MFQQQQQEQSYLQPHNFHNCNASFNESMFFNPETAQEICPGIWLGPYTSLLTTPQATTNLQYAPPPQTQTHLGGGGYSFISNNNIKIIINCGSTLKFLDLIENSPHISISSDVLVLSLDPSFDLSTTATTTTSSPYSNSELVQSFTRDYSKILQNYMNSFYFNNPNANNLIHNLPQNHNLTIESPILNGSNLKLQFFKLIRLISLFKLINFDLQCLFVSEDGNGSLSTGLTIAYLMDCYRYNFQNSFNLILERRPTIRNLQLNYYDDLLIIENLKKFYGENIELKGRNPNLLMNGVKRTSGGGGEDGAAVEGENRRGGDPRDEIMVGGDRKRKLH
ncbi:hypothetical protein CANMA_002202 [Candida margitis]|uniref:uncharacterized protein n=1 Tax=Candida margitis TaxID=1775924 RepID=UPI002226B1EA|nr:uncharacterized protein CANMA_002202 [Candida margitis]KAI5968766.1 hypothetical protein CANMA_002202 [Candida margitis]